jgi:histidine ammonia-lyase
MGVTSALKLRDVAENLEQILALELLCAAQGIDFRKKVIGEDKKLGQETQPIYEKIRERVPFIEKDEYLKVHIDAVREVVRQMHLP